MKKSGPTIAVSDARGYRSLHVGGEAIQSTMKLGDPFALALDYTRCMMAFLLFHPQPREALMIGLGGGSLAKFFHKHLRETRVRVVELDPRIVDTFLAVANWTRRLAKNASGPTKRASARSRARVAKAASISRPVLALRTWICSPMARAAGSTSLNVVSAVGPVGLTSTATRAAPGTS